MARESDNDGTVPQEDYAELERLGYPSLDTMLRQHASLFSRLVMCDLASDFAGSMIPPPSSPEFAGVGYCLHDLGSIDVIDGYVVALGKLTPFRKARD